VAHAGDLLRRASAPNARRAATKAAIEELRDSFGAATLQPGLSLASRASMQRPSSSQTAGNAQSATCVQVERHAPPRQAYGWQSVVTPVGARNVRSSRHTDPLTHSPVGRSQPKPSAQSSSFAQRAGHVVSKPLQIFGEQEGVPRVPAGTTEQVPFGELQTSQAPSHAVLQQNPSAQNPVAHSLPTVQTSPTVFLHSPFASHEPAQASSSADTTGAQAPLAPHLRQG
jgi:hypothetical protein